MTEYHAPRVMGIINCTPDSFFPGSRKCDAEAGIEAARQMIRDGADILDIGGESTRPGSSAVSADQQLSRVIPLIRGIRTFSDISISIDTRNAAVAESALDAGADIVNDISALESDERMASLVADRAIPIVLMHMQGRPENMQDKPRYEDAPAEVRDSLLRSADRALSAGIREDKIILDPGIGFGKRLEDNTALLGRLSEWRPKDYPLLIGLSRKSFLGLILDEEARGRAAAGKVDSRKISEPCTPENRLIASLSAHAWCLKEGVDILRVHDVGETRQLIAVWEAIAWAS